MDSILNSIKKLLGIDESYTVFDGDLIIHINSAINALYQLGVDAAGQFSITDADDSWDDLILDTDLNLIKTYVFLKVKLLFDPPTGSALQAYNEQLREIEWRINIYE